MTKQFRGRHFTFFFQLTAFLLLSTPIFAQQTGRTLAKQHIDNIAHIAVTFSDGGQNSGFGFVVGERDNKLFIATAAHVVRAQAPDITTQAIQVRFARKRGVAYSARLLNLAFGDIDLALIEMPKPFKADYWGRIQCNHNPKAGSLVWFVGRKGKWYTPTDKGAGVISEIDKINHQLITEIYSVKPGTSGAPLFDQNGIVGMITEDAVDEAIAIDITTIKRIVAQKWRYPWLGKTYQGQASDGANGEKPAPVVFTFENKKEIFDWHSNAKNDKDITLQQSASHAADGSHSLRVDMQKADYPSIITRKFPRDWSKYKRLTANIYMADSGKEMEQLSVRIDDVNSTSVTNRFHYDTVLARGANKIEISTADIAAVLDIHQIQMVVLFLMNPSGKTTLYFDDIRIE